ncbi:MAG: zinc ribbon domain-containing protein [Actinomycetota bacterium]
MTTGGGGGFCPRCGALVEPGQEYCLECGLRQPGGGLAATVGTAWQQRVRRRLPGWLLPILAALLVAAVMTGVAILISRGSDGGPEVIDATGPSSISTPSTETAPTEPTTTAQTESEPTPTATEPPPAPQLVDWPPSQNGYTIVIASLPASGGRAQAIRKAREVLASKLPEVGVIDSGEFSSLHPGYYVVFSGIYADQQAALQGVGRVQNLYPAAYIRQISR